MKKQYVAPQAQPMLLEECPILSASQIGRSTVDGEAEAGPSITSAYSDDID